MPLSKRSSYTEYPKRLHFIPNHRIRSRLTRSAAPSSAFEGGVKKRLSGSTLSLRPELRPRGKPRPLDRGVDGLTSSTASTPCVSCRGTRPSRTLGQLDAHVRVRHHTHQTSFDKGLLGCGLVTGRVPLGIARLDQNSEGAQSSILCVFPRSLFKKP